MRNFRSCVSEMSRTFRPFRWKVAVMVAVGCCEVALSLLFVWVSKSVIDIATGSRPGDLLQASLIMASVMLAQILIRVGGRYWSGLVEIDAANKTRSDVFGRVMRSEWASQDRFHSADAVNRLEEDIRVVVDFLCAHWPAAIVTVVQLVAATVFLFCLAPKLGWILIFIMPVAVIGSRLFFKKMRELTNEIRACDSRIQGHMQENIQQRIVVKTMGATVRVLDRLGLMQKEVRGKTVTRLNYSAVSRAFLQLGFSSGYALAFFYGAFGLKNGTVTYGMMVAFLQLVAQIQRPVADFTRHIPAFIKALSSQERLSELSELPQDDIDSADIIPGVPGIRIKGVKFAYPGIDRPVFSDLNFDFKPGTMTAILGSTGAGKSTLIRVVMGLLKPSEGSVELYTCAGEESGDSCPAMQTGAWALSNFMYVPQGNTLLSGTLRSNLLMAAPSATEAELREALSAAVADFVFELPLGLDTPCSEIGRGLSEGQAQRISIARALLRPGGILILDEATSALDADTELSLLNSLADRYKGRKTILCITHRPAATTYADAVLKL